ncbi:MAG: dihydrolipoamide dehydrogenase [Candidatus Saganbacteria bacterium]|uniref:Dihydrolipoyl dehydrogenase n=1 Tax=Candidatus Saganbacteria bacterium TaxID=2575572 RepID=A0A833L0K2_UNCSA|nr:MAG: dihydrolipoamide dehydrogenase [Candidatus Saganbacteria bacterium]
MSNEHEIAVLGGGPAGYAAAIRAAQLGAKVVLIEKDKVGGTCLNRGCIPTKAIIACTTLFEKIKKAESFGITSDNPSINLEKVIARKDQIISKLVKGLEFLIEKNGITIVRGQGKVLAPNKLEIETSDGRRPACRTGRLSVISRKLIIATGSTNALLPGFNFDHSNILNSDDILNLTEVPEKLTIVGGGVIGIHFAAIFSLLGTEVTVYEALPEILSGIDEEVVSLVKRILKRKNVSILTGTRFEKATGKILICVGRLPSLLGLEALNLKMDGKSIFVNEKMETNVPNTYAVGDAASKKMLAHVAFEQGVIAAENALGANRTFNYNSVPIGIYTSPEIGSVGLTEKEAREKHSNIKVGKFPYSALGIANAMGEAEGFIKIISDDSGKILGAHIIGAEATTLISNIVIAMKQGISADKIGGTFQSHPSYSEGVQEAAEAIFKASLHMLNQ